MRFLKKKIARASQFKEESSSLSQISEENPDNTQKNVLKQRRRLPGFSYTPEKVKVTKNIVLNYGKAISSFATSRIALFYLEPLADQENVTIKDFQKYVKTCKNNIGGISSLRSLLLISNKDSQEEVAYKKIFSALAEVFIKYFSVNWITHGKMGHKDVYLKYRFKMLRRIKNPATFTYLLG